VHNTPLDQQFEDRLALIDTADEASTIVPDLPLIDFLAAVVVLAAAVAALMWWAY
jgi:hypothetical protein